MQPQQPQQPVYPTPQEHSAPSTQPTPSPQEPLNSHTLPSAFSLFKPSMEAIWFNIGTFLVIGVLLTAASSLLFFSFFLNLFSGVDSTTVNGIPTNSAPSWLLPVAILAIILCIPVFCSSVYVQIKSVRRQKVGIGEALKQGLHFSPRLVGLFIITGILIFGGLILLIVPGLFMMRRYILSSYYLVDQNLSIGQAMNKSAAESKQFSSAVWGLIGVQFLLAILSAIPLIGFAFSIIGVLYSCAPSKRYDEIQNALKPAASHTNQPAPTPQPVTNPVPPTL